MKEPNFSELMKRVLLQTYAPASVITDMTGNILFVYGDTGKYLRPSPGEPSHNVIDMARDGLQQELRIALKSASQGELVMSREVTVNSPGHSQVVSLKLDLLPTLDVSGRLLLVSFQDVALPPTRKSVRGKVSSPRQDPSATRGRTGA